MPQKPDHLSGLLDDAQRQRLRTVLCENEMYIVSCVYWRNEAPWDVPWRTCPDSFILLPTAGAFRAYLDDHEGGSRGWLVRPGEYLMLPEGRRHTLEIAENCERLEQISIHATMADRWGRPLAARFSNPVGRFRYPDAVWQSLRDLASLLADVPETGRAFGETVLRAMMTERVRDATDFQPDAPGADPRIAIALESMQQSFSSPAFSVEQLAREARLSPVQFRKLFRQSLGVSPKEHLQRMRLRRAARLLLRTAQPVRRVAEECGFASDHYFHLVFREAFHMTPSEYRAQGGP